MSMLPEWAVVKPKRLAHIERVAALVDQWAHAAQVSDRERERWLSAAWLHDALRDEKPDVLRQMVAADFADWPDSLLHGPAAARKIEDGGAADRGLLTAVTYHTVGHADFDAAGRALYLADFLEPGRTFDPIARATLRARMPDDEPAVLRAVVRSRMIHLVSSHKKIRRETVAFWNSIAE